VIIPSYTPDPIEVPGNVHEQRYRVRVRYNLRAVLYLAGMALAVAALQRLLPVYAFPHALGAYFSWTLLLGLVRIRCRGTPFDADFCTWTAPITILTLALLVRALPFSPVPFGVGILALASYTFLSGLDFSWPRAFAVATIAQILCASMLGQLGHAFWLMHISFCFYVVYDLWCTQYRRKPTEAFAGALDVLRDYLNVFGWLVRVAQHWRKHRLWTDVQDDLSRRFEFDFPVGPRQPS
jgi:hypothetical protein